MVDNFIYISLIFEVSFSCIFAADTYGLSVAALTPAHIPTHTCHKCSGRHGPLKLLSDSQSEPDPCNTKGHDKRPLDFSVVLFSRHNLTHGLSVTSQMRPWHLGHLSAARASFSDRLTWHRAVGHRWQLDQEVCSLGSDLRDGRISFNPLLQKPLDSARPSVLITAIWPLKATGGVNLDCFAVLWQQLKTVQT